MGLILVRREALREGCSFLFWGAGERVRGDGESGRGGTNQLDFGCGLGKGFGIP